MASHPADTSLLGDSCLAGEVLVNLTDPESRDDLSLAILMRKTVKELTQNYPKTVTWNKVQEVDDVEVTPE